MLNIDNKIFEVVKEKTNIRGYWECNKRLYRDYIVLYTPLGALDFDNKVQDLFYKGEKAVFVTGKNKAFVLYPDNKQEKLASFHSFIVDNGKYSFSAYKVFLKGLLTQYGGFTVIKKEGYNIFLAWSK